MSDNPEKELPDSAPLAVGESEERFRALVTATSDVVYRMNPDWTILHQLHSGSFLSGTGTPIRDWLDKYVEPGDHEAVLAQIQLAIKNRSIFHIEHRVRRADGTYGWTDSRAVPIFSADGDIIEWFGTATDISARKQMEEDLKNARDEAEQRKRLYETVTSNTPDLIYVFDLEYRFTYANQALLSMWGKTWDESIGKRLIDNGYEPWHAEMHEREIDQVVATKKAIRGEVSFPHATQGRRVYDYIFSPVINEHGDVEAIAGTTRDISDIKEDEQRKNDFISMVSHELKTPLTSTMSYVQVAQKRAANTGDNIAEDMLHRASKQLVKMTRMINGFLNVSRLETAEIHIERQHFDMSVLLNEVREETEAAFSSHTVIFRSEPSLWVNADREKIGQVFNNLISNAMKYSANGSVIEVSVRRAGQTVQVSVSDQGKGINQEDLPLLFGRYYRVKNADTHHIAGFGIGLYLCAEILKRHSGSIWAESELGKGSVFHFTLSASQQPDSSL